MVNWESLVVGEVEAIKHLGQVSQGEALKYRSWVYTIKIRIRICGE